MGRVLNEGDATAAGKRKPVPWWPQHHFRHAASGAPLVEELNATGGIAVDFTPFAKGANTDVLVEGCQSNLLCSWTTQSTSGFLTVPKFEADVITIRFITSGQMVRRNRRREHVGSASVAMFVAFRDMRNEEASADFASFGGTITREALLRGHRLLDGEDEPAPELEPVVPVESRQMRAFALSFRYLTESLKTRSEPNDLFYPMHEEILVYQLLTAWPRRNARDLVGVRHGKPSVRLKLALDFIDANLPHALTLADIAAVAGTSVRMLQNHFRHELGLTPLEYIIHRRLDRVKADLASNSSAALSISDAARRWGFGHMSDFSRRYRERFGYLPRDTIRQRD